MRWTLDAARLPSDLYFLRLKDQAGELLWQSPHPERPDFVALGSSRDPATTARIYYGTLFPFARAEYAQYTRLPHDKVMDFIAGRFAPIIADTWRTQAEEWGFGKPLHPEWDADNVVEIIITAPPFALFDGTGTYSVFKDAQGQPYRERRVWWTCDNNNFVEFSLLEDGYKAVFAHEFFHLMQWNVMLLTGQPANYWQFAFVEGQGLFAPSVQYPELALRTEHRMTDSSPYVKEAANGYLARRLNGSFAGLETDREHRFDAALYWRFLYERYGNMAIVRAALEEMVRLYSPDIVEGLPRVMDAAFARADGPFRSFKESWTAFARANYALRLANGRCAAADRVACGDRYFDPDGMYADPPLAADLAYDGSALVYSGAIPSSYGMDFVEVALDPAVAGQPLTIRLQGQGAAAVFNLQVWKLGSADEEEGKPQAITAAPEMVPANDSEGGALAYTVPSVDPAAYTRLALIITRLDGDEEDDPGGTYRIELDAS